MNSKQLFFISLIILSVAMGMNWFKNRPKVPKKPLSKTRQSVNLSDLQLQENDNSEDDSDTEEKDNEEGKKQDPDGEGDGEKEEGFDEGEFEEEEKPEGEQTVASSTPDIASGTAGIVATNTLDLDNPLKDDPIMSEYFKITRNPFETSPYAQLVEKLRIEAELAAEAANKPEEEVVVKVPKILNAKFSATIETNRGLRAIIDGNLYTKNDDFKGHKIVEIKQNLVKLTSGEDTFYIGKTGVKIEVNQETGEISIEDSYE